MPIYEYTCTPCDKRFEAFILRKSDEGEVACPGCGAREVQRALSRPAAVRSGGGDAGAAAPSCGPVG